MSDDATTETLTLVSLPYKEAQRLNRLHAKGEPEGVAFFDELKAGAGECFLCGLPLGPGEGVGCIMSDPRAGSEMAMVGRQCDTGICGNLTYQQKLHRLIKIYKAMYGPGWHARRPGWRR
jgi:hypothetical protein